MAAQAAAAETRDGVTYLDRGVVAVARALAAARQSRAVRGTDAPAAERAAEQARLDVATAVAAAGATGDELASAVFGLAAARVAAALGDPAAEAAVTEADAALHRIGVAAPGWRRLFDLALDPAAVRS